MAALPTSLHATLPGARVAEPQQSPVRKHTEVAVGILLRADGALLLSTRPPGKVYEGYWEFPGGKLEAGETVEEALRRELQEELGITIGAAHAWRVELVDYPHSLVRLNFCKVFAWQGTLQMREQQAYSWQVLPVRVQPMLPGAVPVLDWLAAEQPQEPTPAVSA